MNIYILFTIVSFVQLMRNTYCSQRKVAVVEKVLENTRIKCSAEIEKTSYTVVSEMQCVQKCLREDECAIANYRGKETEESSVVQNNCIIYQTSSSLVKKNCATVAADGWTAYSMSEQEKMKPSDGVYTSCKELLEKHPNTGSGVYKIKSGDSIDSHFCAMNLIGCGTEGGWTLAMKINGSKKTFGSDSVHWTTNTVYNTDNAIKSIKNGEAKFSAFNTMNINAVCLGFQVSSHINWLPIFIQAPSLLDVFKDGTYQATSYGRNQWKGLIADSSLQLDCNREGFNVKNDNGDIFARIGIIGNNGLNDAGDCSLPNSYIGFGTKLQHSNTCTTKLDGVACGNLAMCQPDNGVKAISAIGYLYIQ
eukprot:gene327-959_t